MSIRSVCVFCGARNDVNERFLNEGRRLGAELAQRKLHLVFGAGDCGVMGAVSNGTLDAGGTVTGVFPRVLDGIETEHKHLTETIIVDDMHTRKMNMFDRSDAFVILPGGFGTMDETFEVITWKQLNTHEKPIILYNLDGYWDLWEEMTDRFIEKGFASKETRSLYHITDDRDEIFTLLEKS